MMMKIKVDRKHLNSNNNYNKSNNWTAVLLVINKKITSSFVGERRSESAGSGLIFKDHSPYVFGDDFKHIDWKVYAKTDKLFVKRYEEDRNLTVHIVIDFSGSMDFGSKVKKFEYASMIGLGFAHIALRNNEKFVLTTFDDKLDFFRAKKPLELAVLRSLYLSTGS